MNHGSIVMANAATSTAQWPKGGLRPGSSRDETTGITSQPTAASANGNSTKIGRLSAVTPSMTPSAANRATRRDCSALTAIHMAAVNTNVVHTSVITSAPKYGSGEKSAVAAAAAMAIDSGAMRRAMANTSRQVAANSTVWTSTTGSCPGPATL